MPPDPVFGPALIKGGYECPDCYAGPGSLCHHWCPRYAEDPGDPIDPNDRAFEDAQAGEHPDGF